jgi:DMSO/TMAO reductase YedYZ molybdopterin-dependent catalytic subunit
MRIPPGQYVTQRFPVLTYGPNPPYDLATWSLSADGEVEAPFALRWDELQTLPQHDVTVDIHCVTRWSKLGTTWRGVRARDLLERGAPVRLLVPGRPPITAWLRPQSLGCGAAHAPCVLASRRREASL